LNELSDRRLTWQPDIYQRYSCLARLTDVLCGEGSGALALLDVGSGPVSLAAGFISPRFEIVRADVSQFDDPSIVLLHPGEPLPFDDAAFDVVVAVEVLEHVPPAQRPGFIRELQRVSRQATIVCCPVNTPEVVEAERQFSSFAKKASGRDVDFLVEHLEHGLPDAAEVVSWFSEPTTVLVADNAPLDEWFAFNTIDFIYACDLGDDETKARFAAAVNARTPLARTGAAHYRRFFCSFTSPAHAATAARVIDAARSPDPVEPQGLVRELVTGILGWRQELRERSSRELEALHRRVGELDAALLHWKEAIAQKDAHIGKLDQHLATTTQSLQKAQEAIALKDARLLELEVTANVAAEAAASARESAGRTTALERELQVILTSRSWRLTAPLRRIRGDLRPGTFITSLSWRLRTGLRRFRQALQQRTLISGLRRRVTQRIARLRHDPRANEGGLAASAAETETLGPVTLESGRLGYVPPQGRLPWVNPINLIVRAQLASEPRLNVLLPSLAMRHMSGGPNTALEIAGRLALSGVRVRLISTDFPFDRDRAPFRAHMRGLLGTDLPDDVQLVSADDRAVPLAIGARDLFMATAWWTAQQAKYAVRQTQHSRFVYLIQDYEPLFHPASTQQALAVETYSLDHLPVVNSRWLHDFLVRERIGRFADPAFVERSLVFQPAVDRTLYFPAFEQSVRTRRRLLFYARPTQGLRNLFELGVAALEKAVTDGTLDPDHWEIVGMGEPFPAVSLGRGAKLVPAPWLDLAGYAQQMRDSDILLSLMLSPHPSYPPLEMAACGGLVVTTAFATKTPEALAGLSANIIGIPPTLEGISEGLEAAVARLGDVERRRSAAVLNLPESWRNSLAEVVPKLFDELVVIQGSPVRDGGRSRLDDGTSIVAPGFRNWPRDEYEVHRLQAFARRRTQYPSRPGPGLISLLTPVWNSPPEYLEALADSVLSQDADAGLFEWIVLDNGSDNPGTKASLDRIRNERGVTLVRSARNVGIIEGTHLCLEHAVNRYTATVDHDDLLTPDCIRVVAHALGEAGYPALAYTDEDKFDGVRFSSPYLKPSFDPVLFANSCYIAHLSMVDRELAMRLGAYTDTQAEGSHDWDTFTRFVAAGHTPLHIPEVLYSWRIHGTSTAGGNHQSKPWVHDSQRHVVTKLLERLAPTGGFRVERPPFGAGLPDWWMRRGAKNPRPITSVVLGSSPGRPSGLQVPQEIPHEVVHLDPADGVAGLARIAARAAESGRLLHVLWQDTRVADDAWALEAMGLFELFPDTAMVGGRLHQNGRIIDAGAYFGFGRGCDAPDRGRPLDDPGYHAQAWKPHSVSAVPFDHCVLDSQFAASTFDALAALGTSLDQLGAWLGAAARRHERRVIYTPFLSAMPSSDRCSNISAVASRAFSTAHRDLMPDALLWPPQAGLTRARTFRSAGPHAPAVPGEPEGALSYDQALEADRLVRALLPRASSKVSFSILTSVYARTPARFFEQTARSLFEQRHADFEWIVLENGPVPDDVARVLGRIAADDRVQRFSCADNAGIQGAMRQCLARASREFVIPLDADDLLEPDALEVLAAAIDREQADFVFSDEDHLSSERMHTPYSRPGFDPVLNLESSYIWHLCAFNRERALELGVYSDDGAEYCHDWDTVVRFSEAGLRIAHVPHVLYHWRTHAESQSNTGTQNPGSLASMRAVVESVLARRGTAGRYEVAEFPVFRGAVEWWIRRRPIGDPDIAVMVLGATEADVDALRHVPGLSLASHVLPVPRRLDTLSDWRMLGDALPRDVARIALLDLRCRPTTPEWVWEAAKWFELQPDVAIVGGRILDDRDCVVDAGSRVTAGETRALYQGLHRADAGAFALALKPQTIGAPAEGLLVVERRFLEAAIESITRHGFTRRLGATLGAFAKVQHRRVVYSPLVEARRIHIAFERTARVDDTFLAEEDSRFQQRAPGDGPALRLIVPADWQHVGTRPEFKALASDGQAGGHVRLYGRDDYFGRGIEAAALVASVRLEPGDQVGVLVGMSAAPLPEGDYVVALTDATGSVLSVSGVCLRDVEG
jgi:glycosyltransferase involved in cell wall biosynthesis